MSDEPISREDWLNRCAARLIERAALTREVALDIAEAQLENIKEDLTENPEDMADEELSCWGD